LCIHFSTPQQPAAQAEHAAPSGRITVMAKPSKRFKTLTTQVNADATHALDEAVKLLKSFDSTKFDQTVEIAMRLGIDPKQADQLVRGSIVLPHGIGKTQRVIVFAKGEMVKAATDAGADEVGQEELAKKIKDGWVDFDACIASPDMMGVVGPLGKVLGPRGLMPSPRAGTVTQDVAKVVKEYKAGKVEFRNDSAGIIHARVGKLSFSPQNLEENIQAFINYITSLKPAAVKGTYVKGIAVSATMSPGVRIAA
jgi:large subunit ribosomal protein L1